MKWLLFGGLFCGLATMSVGCNPRSDHAINDGMSGQTHVPVSWDSPEVIDIWREWGAERDRAWEAQGPDHTKDFAKDVTPLGDRLKQRFGREGFRELARSCTTMPIRDEDRNDALSVLEGRAGDDRIGVAHSVLHVLVVDLIDSGDRAALVDLLSTRFPQLIYFSDTEYYLVIQGNAFTEPITILFDAYDKCQEPGVRHDIAEALRRGFYGSGIRGGDEYTPAETGIFDDWPGSRIERGDDSEFVEAARDWYQANKELLVPNVEYGYNAGSGFGYDTRPLFTMNHSAADAEDPRESEE